MELLAELPWAFTYFSPTAFTPAGRQLQMLGVEPRVQIVVESFLALPFVIAETDRLALVQSRLVPRLTATRDIRALRCPFDAIPIAERCGGIRCTNATPHTCGCCQSWPKRDGR